jgi:hypothetical protein
VDRRRRLRGPNRLLFILHYIIQHCNTVCNTTRLLGSTAILSVSTTILSVSTTIMSVSTTII